jgi:hypothetical protein
MMIAPDQPLAFAGEASNSKIFWPECRFAESARMLEYPNAARSDIDG